MSGFLQSRKAGKHDFSCHDPIPVSIAGQDTGFDQCAQGFVHRRASVQCPDLLPDSGNGCRTDADCGAGRLCHCGDPIGQCVKASCRTDADCASGYLCASYSMCEGGGEIGFACQTPADYCTSDSDCDFGGFGGFCDYFGYRICQSLNDFPYCPDGGGGTGGTGAMDAGPG